MESDLTSIIRQREQTINHVGLSKREINQPFGYVCR